MESKPICPNCGSGDLWLSVGESDETPWYTCGECDGEYPPERLDYTYAISSLGNYESADADLMLTRGEKGRIELVVLHKWDGDYCGGEIINVDENPELDALWDWHMGIWVESEVRLFIDSIEPMQIVEVQRG